MTAKERLDSMDAIGFIKKFNISKADALILSDYIKNIDSNLSFWTRPKYLKKNIVPITKQYGISSWDRVSLSTSLVKSVLLTDENFDNLLKSDKNELENQLMIEKNKTSIEINERITNNVKQKIISLYSEGQKLAAVKYCKDETGLGLKEAKDYVEYLSLNKNPLKSEKNIEASLIKVDILQNQLKEIQDVKIIDISDYKKIIIDNEKNILEKGGDNQLFSFMKINTFLNDYRGRIISDQSGLKEVLDIKWLKSRIESEEKRNDLDKISENLEDSLARLEGRKTTGFDSSVNSLFELGDLMKPSLENQIKTMEFYRNMAVVMIVFYLDDKKIRYFELYEAFEKLGVFDSTWQKNVLNKLDNIEIRLAQISNQLTELNQNFISLSESSENIVLELKEINSSVMTNNMLQAITAYQTWRINKNTKSLRP